MALIVGALNVPCGGGLFLCNMLPWRHKLNEELLLTVLKPKRSKQSITVCDHTDDRTVLRFTLDMRNDFHSVPNVPVRVQHISAHSQWLRSETASNQTLEATCMSDERSTRLFREAAHHGDRDESASSNGWTPTPAPSRWADLGRSPPCEEASSRARATLRAAGTHHEVRLRQDPPQLLHFVVLRVAGDFFQDLQETRRGSISEGFQVKGRSKSNPPTPSGQWEAELTLSPSSGPLACDVGFSYVPPDWCCGGRDSLIRGNGLTVLRPLLPERCDTRRLTVKDTGECWGGNIRQPRSQNTPNSAAQLQCDCCTCSSQCKYGYMNMLWIYIYIYI